MKKRVILTESQLVDLIERVVKQSQKKTAVVKSSKPVIKESKTQKPAPVQKAAPKIIKKK